MRAVPLIAFFIWLGLVPVSAAADTPSRGEVGGPPTMKHERFPPPTSPVVVIGKGTAFNGPVEIVAYQTEEAGLCIAVDRPSLKLSIANCPDRLRITPDRAVRPDSYHGKSNVDGGPAFSAVAGRISRMVASATGFFSRTGQRRQSEGIVAIPDEAVLAILNEETPFAYFVVTARGCVRSRDFRVAVRDQAGRFLGSARGRSWPNFCGDGS